MKRVMVVGGSGSGKSTLARALAEKTNLPLYHMDKIHWLPGWIERPVEDRIQLAHEVHMKNEWIFEGNFSRTYDERVARADTLVWLDMPLWLRFYRVLHRSIRHYGKFRPDIAKPICFD